MKNISIIDLGLVEYADLVVVESERVLSLKEKEEKESLLGELMDRYGLSSEDTPDLDATLMDILHFQSGAQKTNSILKDSLKFIREHSDNETFKGENGDINIDMTLKALDETRKKVKSKFKDTFNVYKKEIEDFEKSHKETMKANIKEMLSVLDDDEVVSLNSNNCDGEAIMIGTYTDCINKVDKKGITTVYNNYDCWDEGKVHENVDIFDYEMNVLFEVAESIEKYLRDTERLK